MSGWCQTDQGKLRHGSVLSTKAQGQAPLSGAENRIREGLGGINHSQSWPYLDTPTIPPWPASVVQALGL